MFNSHLRSALLILLGIIATNLPLAAQGSNGGRPQDATAELILPAGEACRSFDVSIAVEGKLKTIALGDRSIILAPGQRATITNLSDPTRTVKLNITGSWHVTEMADGTFVYQVTGRNLLWGGTLQALTLTFGIFTFTLDANFEETVALDGHGQRLDVCAMIS